jgi:large subunit ribosomal protein L22
LQSLKGVPSSPRKMRYVVDMIRGMEVNRALGVLKFSKKQLLLMLRNFCVPLLLTGKQRMTAKLKMVNFIVSRVFVDEGVQ